MAGELAAIKGVFLGDEARAAYNTALGAAGLRPLVGLRANRELLRGAGAWPLLAVELGDLRGERRGACGLRAWAGRATLILGLGGPDPDALVAALPAYLDALRAAVDSDLRRSFAFLWPATAQAEGEAWAARGVHLRTAELAYEFVYLYQR